MSRSRADSISQNGAFSAIYSAFITQVKKLDLSLSPRVTISKLRSHTFTKGDVVYIVHLANAIFWLHIMEKPSYPLKLVIPLLYSIALLIPLTSQFFVPATPIFTWLLTYYSSRFLPASLRPHISVTTLPTLESVLYGANISDILTRFTHPALDILAWLPYGVGHFSVPFVVAFFLWLFAPRPALQYWASAFGYMNLAGVLCQIFFPCAPPCESLFPNQFVERFIDISCPGYELIYGLTPADYSMPGSAGGLARIDALFGGTGYQVTFSSAPVVFGAFPSLHSAGATIEALFVSHFFPKYTRYIWIYVAVLDWATMYLTHHYLIDVVVGASLAIIFYMFLMPEPFRKPDTEGTAGSGRGGKSKYEAYDLEDRRRRNGGIVPTSPGSSLPSSGRNSFDAHDDEEHDITYSYGGRSPRPPGSAAPFIVPSPIVPENSSWQGAPKRSHRHTASIASLIRSEDRTDAGWSPISTAGFVFPPQKNSNNAEASRG